MKKRAILLTINYLLLTILLASSFVLAVGESSNVCCEQTKSGDWCENTIPSECVSGSTAAQTSCAQTSFCQLGTCVNPTSGICMPNTGRAKCLSLGGDWRPEDKQAIPMCAAGCCSIGDEVAFVSQTECKQLASDYGVPIEFKSEITDEPSCLALAEPKEKGACLVTDGGVRSCSTIERGTCISVGGTFYPEILCTAPELEADCAPSSNTQCYKDDVYFLDTCGNLANIYDEQYDPNLQEDNWGNRQRDYWTDVITDYDGMNLVGDCDYATGSTCATERGVNFCKDLSCDAVINGAPVKKEHGESWCAETPGTIHHVTVDPETMEYLDDSREELIENYDSYNIPGSRYVRLQCWEGEVIEEPCADFRNEICKEADIGTEDTGEEFTIAQCRGNTWRECLDMTNRVSCEDDFMDCVWMEGYRFDLTEVPWPEREDSQGSCLPLYAPGFDFWNPETDGQAICQMASASENVLYETHWLSESRDNLQTSKREATQNCYDNCYATPGYGQGSSREDLEKIHLGETDFDSQSYISDRLGYYCEGKTGAVNVLEFDFSEQIKCATEADQPIFYTNEDWLNFLTHRASVLGDCGYEPNVVGETSDNSTEIITALFQKLTQSGEVKENSTTEQIYVGDSWTDEDERAQGLDY